MKKNKIYYWGIDVGKISRIEILGEAGNYIGGIPVDISDDVRAVKIVDALLKKLPPFRVAVEKVGTFFGGRKGTGGIKATSTIVESLKFWKVYFACREVSLLLVAPQTWQKVMCPLKKVTHKKKTKDLTPKEKDQRAKENKKRRKDISVTTAQRLFPKVDFRRTKRCKGPDNNRTDAVIICEWCRRQ